MDAKKYYKNKSEEQYEKKTLTALFMGDKLRQQVVPFINGIKQSKVLEVGLGYGRNTRHFINNGCDVTGVDINPKLAENLGISVFGASAAEIGTLFPPNSFDYVLSFWMTEYLTKDELKQFILQGYSLVKAGGKFATTVFEKRGFGRLYVGGAKLKGLKKTAYKLGEIKQILSDLNLNSGVTIKKLHGEFKIPAAMLIEIEKASE